MHLKYQMEKYSIFLLLEKLFWVKLVLTTLYVVRKFNPVVPNLCVKVSQDISDHEMINGEGKKKNKVLQQQKIVFGFL